MKLKNFKMGKIEVHNLYRNSEGNGFFLYRGQVDIKGKTKDHGFFCFAKNMAETKRNIRLKFKHLTK